MFKLYTAILKDLRILLRDKAALAVMFAMPVLLVVVITSIQYSTFKLVNENKVALLLCNKDEGEAGDKLAQATSKVGMFNISEVSKDLTDDALTAEMHKRDALVVVVIPAGFSSALNSKTNSLANKALSVFGVAASDTVVSSRAAPALRMFYNPVLQESFRLSVKGALRSAQQFTENGLIVEALYKALNNQKLPDDLRAQLTDNQTNIEEIPAAKDGSKTIPNVTQHNVPAWTIFAMFFIVISLSTGIVKEKLSGSFIRLKTLPTSYFLALTAKQISYIIVTLAQVLVIFSIGVWLFPYLELPVLTLPDNLISLLLVSIVCGWCAVSYGMMIGVFAKTMEVAIGFGAVSVVILAAVGGIIVPAFAMPESLHYIMLISPLHWCLRAYETVFLGSGQFADVCVSLLPLFIIIATMQLSAAAGLKKANII